MTVTAERGRRSGFGAKAVPIAAVAAMVLGYVLVASTAFVRGPLLDERVYQDALARADVYQRAYAEVLTDPEVVTALEDVLGSVRLVGVDPAAVRVLSTNSLRWAVPPSVLRTGSERLVQQVAAYVRGDIDRIDADVDLQPVLDRVEDVVVERARAALALADDELSVTVDDFRVAVDEFTASIAAGEIPASVPVPAEGLDPEQVAAIVDEVAARTGADPVEVGALVAGGSERDALVVAVTEVLEEQAARSRDELRATLEAGRDFDPIAELASHRGQTEEQVRTGLNTARDTAAWFGTPTLLAGIVLLLGGIATIVHRYRAHLRRMALLLAGGLLAAALTSAIAWLVVRGVVQSSLDGSSGSGPGTWDLPAGLRAVLGDVRANVASSLGDAAWRMVYLPLAAGAVFGLVAVPWPGRRRLSPPILLGGAGAAVAMAAVFLLAPSGRTDDACNGHLELCDRPYDEVSQVATHNSMSSPDVVRVWPEHDETIAQQLDSGVRTLLIDTHYWTPVTGPEQLAALEPEIPLAVIEAALERQDQALEGRPGAFLCHSHCIWGSVPVVEALEDVRVFLEDNPQEVVTLIVQDAITVEDTVAAFEEAGLNRYLHVHERGSDWATFGELIEADERLVVFAEEQGGAPDWYHEAFVEMQDTPFRFPTLADLSCERYRGPEDAPLFLMNHWLQGVAPDRKNAVLANTEEVIVGRARECEAERGQLPNFVAVDFSSIGDVMAAVDALNGV